MFNPNILILIIIILFGTWASYTDLKKSKIKNYTILLLILMSIILNIFITKVFITNPLQSATSIFIAIVAGVLIWLAGLWSAADAKLFIAFNFLIPVTLYTHAESYFPGSSILINSFVPLFLFSFIQVIFKTKFKEKKAILGEFFKFRFILNIILPTLTFMSLSYAISHFLKIPIDYFLTTIMFFIIFWVIEQKFKFKLNYFFLIMTIVSVIFLHSKIFTLGFLVNWIIAMVTVFSMFFLTSLGRFTYTQSVRLTELKEGIIPAEMIVNVNEKYLKKPIIFISPLLSLRERSSTKLIFGYNPDGIKKDDIAKVMKLYKEGKLGFDEIKVSKTMKFAPFLFLGVLLTYFAKGYFIYLFL